MKQIMVTLHDKLVKFELFFKLTYNHMELLHTQAKDNLAKQEAKEQPIAPLIISINDEPYTNTK